LDALREYVESGEENGSDELPHPRWARVNSLKSTLEAQLETTFANYDRVASIDAVRQRKGGLRIFLDPNVPNLVAVPQFVDLSKSDAYKSGALIIQDKASCFPACLLDPLPQDGDAIDTCAAPGNKTTHLASILHDHASDHDSNSQKIHAFEKNKVRGETLKKMVTVAGGQDIIEVHSNQDFLKIDPHDPKYANVGALLLDPSCSGSGIVGRDDMPELHLPSTTAASSTPASKPGRKSKAKKAKEEPRKEEKPLKRKRDDAISSSTKTATTEEPLDIIDDDGQITPVTTQKDLQTRLDALASFQLMLLKHAMSFPAARKITYSTCSVHATENEDVVFGALCSDVARQRGWRILRREEQVKGMKEWPVRGDRKACEEEAKGTGEAEEVAEGCIRANKGDEHGTMGFFLAGFVRDQNDEDAGIPVRDVPDKADGPPRKKLAGGANGGPVSKKPAEKDEEREEWSGFEDDEDQ
jgi:putative methyltransferase